MGDDPFRMEFRYPEAGGLPPVVLSIAGSDPSAGAGAQADLLTLASLGVHGCTAVTALTVQDSVDVRAYTPVSPENTVAQARAVLDDMSVRVIKIGMLGSAAMVAAVSALLADYPRIPVVLDPVLAAGGGAALAGAGLREALVAQLLPQVTVMTPNGPEALALSGASDLPTAGAWLNRQGAEWVLISGGHGEGPELENMLFRGEVLRRTFRQPRLPHHYHGSGCTLAAALAAGLARGLAMEEAVSRALDFTHTCLLHAHPLGKGQYFPDRFFWARGYREE
ncbi:hydroxymethylpyrimidine/phosphomethylpyrimidine kinase [Acidithiobacillus ferriphilus]|nr:MULTISPECIES: hydroxymethylpyrimidine/phosphomethylpyrimidine kinase [Acidithiobacillus]MEB8522970.1 hydroxymethylpyrimidine/phosphomethylpyrimidine kinase [Acidithiobacillus ferriphilus]MEB8531756.1 hydroxymethylpyrimidine/phosphomethylpyrimidine kinase [Acidithiobacillus ferriphilus]MEB8584512.1 hydroxymethylpyrimidine/phosphomethylpyrimidine kinase [Acidithiobacillus ferriphilus]MEB8604507.1 hydroxymethylpyrimidine/phosphomethylpyrimidine kinase [Acidithiobacillus ferriphilus]